jgi:cytochrome P450
MTADDQEADGQVLDEVQDAASPVSGTELSGPVAGDDMLDIDIYGFWSEARQSDPVVGIDVDAEIHPMWMLTKHSDVESVLRDPDRFSSRINNETMGPVMGTLILGMDGEEHRKYRALVAQAFRPSALARWEEELITPIITELLDEVAPKGKADLVLEVTSRYPVQVIAGVLGVPVEDHVQFHKWAVDISIGPENYDVSKPASIAMREYLEPIVEDRRANPRNDLISDIVMAEMDGERLSDEHVYGFLRLLLPAGAETTYRMMGSTLFALLSHPKIMERVLHDRSELPGVIEEVLRWETSVTMVNRETLCPVEISGTAIPAGASIVCALGSSNRDEDRYSDPHLFDPDRQGAAHIAFGTGRHQCLGMHLARLELRVGLNAVLDRLQNLRLDPDEPEPRVEGIAFRSPPHLPVLFDPS